MIGWVDLGGTTCQMSFPSHQNGIMVSKMRLIRKALGKRVYSINVDGSETVIPWCIKVKHKLVTSRSSFFSSNSNTLALPYSVSQHVKPNPWKRTRLQHSGKISNTANLDSLIDFHLSCWRPDPWNLQSTWRTFGIVLLVMEWFQAVEDSLAAHLHPRED